MERRTQAYWICQLGGWLLLGLVSGVSAALNADHPWWSYIFITASCVMGLGLTHGYRHFVRQRRWSTMPLQRLVPRILLGVAALSAIMAGSIYGLSEALEPWNPYDREGQSVLGVAVALMINNSIVMLLWSLIYFGLHYVWNYRQAEVDKWKFQVQAKEARLQALELQLNPHFFFNSLNNVRALIAEDPERAQTAVTQLAGLMRYALKAGQETTVPLRKELEMVRTYLDLEQVRLEDRLRYEIDAEDSALDHPVPLLLVQTLVENGIKHGVAPRPEGGRLTVTARTEGDALCVWVTNTGRLDPDAESGLGLENARERLQLLFGDEATLTLENVEDDARGDGAQEAPAVVAHVAIPEGAAPKVDVADTPDAVTAQAKAAANGASADDASTDGDGWADASATRHASPNGQTAPAKAPAPQETGSDA